MAASRDDHGSLDDSSIAVRRQMAIYTAGLVGQKPTVPIAPAKLEEAAQAVLKPEAFGYIAGGAGVEATMRANRQGFDRWRIVPRFLCDVSRRDLGVTLFGTKLSHPVLLAPI